ncbi:helix-turn-helix domain-containing protein [Streptomyces sp. NPDC049970]|uniref:helix-turn-helix domain-containing protein n=1 Tax=Streptomyces sp. NPDC049970 TaxID=3155033 RepID=UPI00341DF7C0
MTVRVGTEIQDFAAELRRLKERSGLSYGAFARKLHMSTSTVHRYCNGDAVPADYAPVERFARVCRAGPGESVALHRKWILADEAKRRGARRPEAGAGTAPEPAGAAGGGGPDHAGSAEPGPAAGPDGDAATRDRPESEAEPVSRPEAEDRTGTTGPEEAGSKEAGSKEAAGSRPDTPPEPASAGEGTTGDVTPAGRRPRASGRLRTARPRAFLAALAFVALTVPAAVGLHGLTREEASDGVRVGDTSAPFVPSGAEGVSPLAEANRSGLSAPAAGRPATGRPDTGPSATGPSASPRATEGKGGDAESGGVPVNATISSYNWEEPCGQLYLLDQEPDDVPPPPAPQDTRGWAKALGGVDGGAMRLALTLQGTSEEAVVLTGLNVRVLARNPALARSAYSMGTGCGGGITPQSFDIDLDDGRPRTEPVAGTDGDVVVPAKDFPYQVTSTDVEVFHLDAHVEGHDVSWYLELAWTSGGRSGTARIDDGGRPFRTSSVTARPEYRYRPDIAQWELTDM